jgi:hypothetical protein
VWKAGHAVRYGTLVQKLSQALNDILGDTPLAAGAENYLLADFRLNYKLMSVAEKIEHGLRIPVKLRWVFKRTLDLHSD